MHNLSYWASWIYFALALVFLILLNESTNNRKNIQAGNIAFLIILFFAVFRYDIGNDYMTYWERMSSIGEIRELEKISGAIINYATSIRFPPLAFAIFSIISLFCYRFIIKKYSECQVASWYLYFTFPLLFFQDCSTIRQSCAMGFFFLTYFFVDNKKYLKGIIAVILASFFQTSGIISILLFMIPFFKKINLKLNIVLFVATFFIGQIVQNYILNYIILLVPKFAYYMNAKMAGFNTFQYVLFAVNILNFVCYKKLSRENAKNILYINLVNIGVCLFNTFQFETQTAMRLVAFFFLFELLLIPDYRKILVKKFKSVAAVNFTLVTVLFALQIMMVFIYIRSYNNGLLDRPVYAPYQFWFNHI